MRIYLLYIFSVGLAIYCWKDWFKGLCGLIILTAFVMHPDFPKSIAGIQGFNMWNLVFANMSLAWLLDRRRRGLFWDMPPYINFFLVLWLGVILVGFVRMMVDRSQLTTYTTANLVSDEIINVIKWPLVGLILFDGCRTRHRVKLALTFILLLFALFSLEIIKAVPSGAVFGGDWAGRMVLNSRMGLSPNGAGKMMSGVPWAMLAIIPFLKKRKYRLLMVSTCVLSIYSVALAGSRSGFIACFVTLVFLCLIHWRRYLPLLPLLVLILYIAFPGSVSRAMSGFGETSITGETVNDKHEITSGRSVVWPYVISKICESPVWGFGRRAMERTSMVKILSDEVDESVGVHHPHNAYLEVLLESGLIGFVIIVGLHMFILVYAIRLFVDRGDPLLTATGGLTLALLTGHLVAHMGGQSFYPREIDLGLWCAIGVMLRLYVERNRLITKVNDISCQHTHYQGHYGFASTVGRF